MKHLLILLIIVFLPVSLSAQADTTGTMDMNGSTYDNEGNAAGNTWGSDTSRTDETRSPVHGMNQSMTEKDNSLKYASFDEIADEGTQRLITHINLTPEQTEEVRAILKEFQVNIGQKVYEFQEEGVETDLKTGSNEEVHSEIMETENETLQEISGNINDDQLSQWDNIKTQWWSEFTNIVYSGYESSATESDVNQHNDPNRMNNDMNMENNQMQMEENQEDNNNVDEE